VRHLLVAKIDELPVPGFINQSPEMKGINIFTENGQAIKIKAPVV
jgi:hypothetical protein